MFNFNFSEKGLRLVSPEKNVSLVIFYKLTKLHCQYLLKILGNMGITIVC